MSSTFNTGKASPLPNRAFYPQDEISAAKPTYQYAGEIRTVEEYPFLKREIDGAIVFTSRVDSQTRAIAIDALETAKADASKIKEKNESLATRHIIELSSGAAVALVSIPTAIVGAVALPAIFAVLAGSAAVAGVALTVDGIRRYCNSSSQVENAKTDIRDLQNKQMEWQDPIIGLVEQRKMAGQKGFDFVWKKNLKGSVIHPDEVKSMWKNSFQSLVSDPVDIDAAYCGNLLGEGAMGYAYEDSPPTAVITTTSGHYSPQTVNAVARNYRNWRDAYRIASEQKEACLSSLRSQKKQSENEILALKNKWMLPAKRIFLLGTENTKQNYLNAIRLFKDERDRAIAAARRHYAYSMIDPLDGDERAYKVSLEKALEEAIRTVRMNYKNHPEIREIKAAYDYEMRMHNFMLQQSEGIVNNYFDNKLLLLQNASRIAEGQIQSQFGAVREQLKDLLQKVLHPHYQSPLGPKDFSISPITFHCSFETYCNEPKWSQVYGTYPSYRPDFASNIGLDDWNCFWSERGIGAFANRPYSHWESMPGEHIFIRREPVRRAPASGMFFRPLPLPAYVKSAAPRVVPGTNTSTAFGGSARREEPLQVSTRQPVRVPQTDTPAPRVVPGTNASTAFGGSVGREEPLPVPARQPVRMTQTDNRAPRVVPGTNFGGESRRDERIRTQEPQKEGFRAAPGNRSTAYTDRTQRR